ncbi:MAG: acetyl-CoA C-acyltransferase [Gammaproteobacteria bacterium]
MTSQHLSPDDLAADDIVVLSIARTPLGGFQGDLQAATAPELGAAAIHAAQTRAGLNADQIDEVIMGCVLQAGLGQGPARQAALQAGLAMHTHCATVNKLCGSGMKAVMLAYDALKAGSCRIAIAGGMESMSNAPYLSTSARHGIRMGHDALKDHMFLDGLEDAQTGRLMGSFAQDTADEAKLTREEMDAFAISSLTRAQTAIENGWFTPESTPITLKTRRGEHTVAIDEQPGKARFEKIPTLKPVFAKTGTITAANSSSISDGAAALVLTSARHAQFLQRTPLAVLRAHASHSQAPHAFTTAPIGAIERVLHQTGWTTSDVDLYEINEAFAMVAMLPIQRLHLDPETVNVFGGACALGHPIGATGARLIVTLINALQQKNTTRGLAALCIGGGEATAITLERLIT